MTEEDFQFLAENSVDIICRCEANAMMRYVSPSCKSILGWAPEEMIDRSISEFVFEDDLHLLADAVARANAPHGVEVASATLRVYKRDRSTRWLEINARILHEAVTGAATSAAVVMRDVTERKLLEEQLARLALTDGLTGLANRRAFDEALEQDWKRTLREGSQMSLLLLDIDRFKQFNDHYGHQFGDDCLRAVSNAIRNVIRRSIDTVARYGGEEIGIILPSTDGVGALELAEAVRQAVVDLSIPHVANISAGGMVSASIGVATALARHGGTVKMPEGILMSADLALYHAKHNGRNRVSTMHLMASKTA